MSTPVGGKTKKSKTLSPVYGSKSCSSELSQGISARRDQMAGAGEIFAGMTPPAAAEKLRWLLPLTDLIIAFWRGDVNKVLVKLHRHNIRFTAVRQPFVDLFTFACYNLGWNFFRSNDSGFHAGYGGYAWPTINRPSGIPSSSPRAA